MSKVLCSPACTSLRGALGCFWSVHIPIIITAMSIPGSLSTVTMQVCTDTCSFYTHTHPHAQIWVVYFAVLFTVSLCRYIEIIRGVYSSVGSVGVIPLEVIIPHRLGMITDVHNRRHSHQPRLLYNITCHIWEWTLASSKIFGASRRFHLCLAASVNLGKKIMAECFLQLTGHLDFYLYFSMLLLCTGQFFFLVVLSHWMFGKEMHFYYELIHLALNWPKLCSDATVWLYYSVFVVTIVNLTCCISATVLRWRKISQSGEVGSGKLLSIQSLWPGLLMMKPPVWLLSG